MKTIVGAVIFSLACVFANANTSNHVSVLSGTLKKLGPKESLMPYCLVVQLAGGGIQKVMLFGDVLRKFDEQIRKFGEVGPVRVKGRLRTEWKDYSGSRQPTIDGWLIWMEVEEAAIDLPPPKPK